MILYLQIKAYKCIITVVNRYIYTDGEEVKITDENNVWIVNCY